MIPRSQLWALQQPVEVLWIDTDKRGQEPEWFDEVMLPFKQTRTFITLGYLRLIVSIRRKAVVTDAVYNTQTNGSLLN
jgi:hypothetical protein